MATAHVRWSRLSSLQRPAFVHSSRQSPGAFANSFLARARGFLNIESVERIKPWFPEYDDERWQQLEHWAGLLREWNEKVNLVSRKDIENLEVKHLAPCLAVTKVLRLMNGARVLDVGTGGGFPGVLLALCYPQAQVLCVDSVGKKIRVVEDLAARLKLKNCEARHCRVETLQRQFDFVTGRAVTALPEFIGWTHRLVRPGRKHSLENGLLYWKGGALEPGIEPTHLYRLADWLEDPYFEEKYLLHLRQPTVQYLGRKPGPSGRPSP